MDVTDFPGILPKGSSNGVFTYIMKIYRERERKTRTHNSSHKQLFIFEFTVVFMFTLFTCMLMVVCTVKYVSIRTFMCVYVN